MMCWHRWTKWGEAVKQEVHVTDNDFGDYDYSQLVQAKLCIHCGKVKVRKVKMRR